MSLGYYLLMGRGRERGVALGMKKMQTGQGVLYTHNKIWTMDIVIKGVSWRLYHWHGRKGAHK